MTDPMQAEREAFEAWFEPNEHNRAAIRAWRSGDGYREGGYYLCGCWNGWQAHAEHIASELRSLRDALALAKSRIAELEKTLAPFAQFGKSDIWAGTMWEDKSEDWQVMYSHATGKFITLGDFLRARAALKEEGQ